MESGLIEAVELFAELYCPQDCNSKDPSTKEKTWNAVASIVGADKQWCKNKWKELRNTFIQMRNQLPPNGSEPVSDKVNTFQQQMRFLVPYIQNQKSQNSLETQSELTESENEEESDEYQPRPSQTASLMEEATSPSDSAISTPQSHWDTPSCTPTSSPPPFHTLASPDDTRTSRAVTPPLHRRTQALASGQNRRSSSCERKRPYSSPTDEDRIKALREPTGPIRPHVPSDAEGVYYFALSLVPSLIALSRRGRSLVQIGILNTIAEVEGVEAERNHRTADEPEGLSPQ